LHRHLGNGFEGRSKLADWLTIHSKNIFPPAKTIMKDIALRIVATGR
jgi:hypothetical protein